MQASNLRFTLTEQIGYEKIERDKILKEGYFVKDNDILWGYSGAN
jgi:hypothetical protein